MNVFSNQGIIRLLTAAILGGLIGFEWERLLWLPESAPAWWCASAPA